jgi:hypothetical protein
MRQRLGRKPADKADGRTQRDAKAEVITASITP